MTLKVVGAGFGRTGTLSLKKALERLGFVKCHHMKEVVPSKKQVAFWHAAAHGEDVDWDEVFEGFEACVDWPSCAYWQELSEKYPESKIILSVREPERWWQSAMSTIYPATNEVPSWLLRLPRMRLVNEMVHKLIWNGTFNGRFAECGYATKMFEQHNEQVRRTIAPGRLLEFRAADGWEPLCAFLGVPVPNEPYPHVNRGWEIGTAVKILRILRWGPHALIAAAFVLALWYLL